MVVPVVRGSCRVDALVEELERRGVPVELVGGWVDLPGDLEAWPRGLVDMWPLLAVEGRAPAPEAVARPRSPEEVALAVEAAASVGGCLVPRCGGSAVTGAALAGRCCVALDLSGLSGVRRLDPDAQVMEAEAGAVVAELEAEARRAGFTLALRPQSEGLACIGGLVSTLGSGAYTPGYGNVEDAILWVEAAVPGLGLARLGSPANARGLAGPAAAWLLPLGAEGGLGVVTAVGLRLRMAPEEVAAEAFHVPSFAAGLRLARRLVQWNPPLTLRVLDSVEAGLHGLPGPVVLVEYAGPEGVAGALLEWAAREASGLGGRRLGRGPVEEWWESRARWAEAARRALDAGAAFETIDFSGHWPALERLHDTLRRELEATGVVLLSFAHASHFYPNGGSLYATIVFERSPRAYWLVWRAAARAAEASGASLVHHHGFGMARLAWARRELGDALRVYCRLKRALDPSMALAPRGLAGLCGCEGEG